MTDARMHYDMAMRMAVDLGMTNSSINLIGDQRDIRVLTWSNLVELHHACELQHRLRSNSRSLPCSSCALVRV